MKDATPAIGKEHQAEARADVICVQPDDWAWGTAELGQVLPGNPNGKHDFWRIIKFPNISVAEGSQLLSEEVAESPDDTKLRKRGFSLDIDKLPNDVQAYLADDTRAVPFIVCMDTTIKTKKKEPLPIGEAFSVIG